MKRRGFSVRSTGQPVDHRRHIRSCNGSVFRELRPGTGSEAEDHHLDKVFYREREAGFSLPDHQVVMDADDTTWLEVERVDGVCAQRVVCPRQDNRLVDDFLSSYTGVLERVIDQPDEPFPSDIGLKQFMYDDEWYVVDLEPRVDYFDTSDELYDSNQQFLSAVNRVVSECDRFRAYDNPLRRTEDRIGDVVNKTLCEDALFDPSPLYYSLLKKV